MAGSSVDMAVFGRDPVIRRVSRRTVLFVRGDSGEEAYAVLTGGVEVRGAGMAIETIGAGGIIGEMALIDGQPRSASAVAIADTELIVIDKECFHRLIAESPAFSVLVMRVLAERLRETDRVLMTHIENLPLGAPRAS